MVKESKKSLDMNAQRKSKVMFVASELCSYGDVL